MAKSPSKSPTGSVPPPPFESDRPDDELCAAVAHLHRDQGVRKLKRVGADVVGVNARNQVTVTSVERAHKHAEFLDENPHLFEAGKPDDEDLAGPDAPLPPAA